MARITLRNDFHGTAHTVRTSPESRLSSRQAREAWRALCGREGCTCGDDCGTRGPQYDEHGQRIAIYPISASEYEVSAIF